MPRWDAVPARCRWSTRSGTNQFRGSAFLENRNSALDASNWFNNFNGVKKDYENRNQFGGRLGGPIIKNKTFFFVLVDEQRDMLKQSFRRHGVDAAGAAGYLPVLSRTRTTERDSEQPDGGPQWQSGEARERDRRSSIRSACSRSARPPRDPSGRVTIRPVSFKTCCSPECRCRTTTRLATA